MHLTQIKSI